MQSPYLFYKSFMIVISKKGPRKEEQLLKICHVESVSKCHPPPESPDWTLNKDYILSDSM